MDLEEKWVKKWEEAKIFEANPIKEKKKIFVTFPFPYMNGPLHIGHAFTSTRCDVYARFKRMQGYNVLFPWAWHLTGEPIAGAAERVKKGDKSQIKIFREIDEVPEEELKKFTRPEYIAEYYIKESKEMVKRLGHSIDWRREFVTTALNPQFSKFIEWQYITLKKKGNVVKGTHPVVWCPFDQSPTGDHDRLIGEGISPVEFTILKFKFKDAYLPAATLRPETLFGVTNMWINPKAKYVKIKVGGEAWIVSKQAAEKIKEQKEIEILDRVKSSEIIGKHCIHPLTGLKILNLPANFVDPNSATGVVMSVPSHAPYDWAALKDLKQNPDIMKRYGIAKLEISPISLIKIEKFGDHPAIEICEKMKIKDQNDPKLEDATELIYKEEFYKGILKENTGKYAGKKVSEVKKELISDFETLGIADKIYELGGEVMCRCGTRCTVKILKDQWFLRYSEEKWKERVKEAIEKIEILPQEAKADFEYVVDWLEDKACSRKGGLGTPLPWDNEWKVETLSDSTVYMAFYTIANRIKNIPSESLVPEVFDFIFYGKGDAKALEKKYRIKEKVLKEMREEFEYWMPIDIRISAKELIPNHLVFYIFHHVWLFPEDKWPRRIGVNGMISVEGEKMSKSLGNFITLKKALREHGADATRAALIYSAEGMRDPDWRAKAVSDIQAKLKSFYSLILQEMEDVEKRKIDEWIISKMQRHIKNATKHYESLRLRSAFQTAFFDVWNDVKWYLKRGEPNKKILLEVFDNWLKLVAPCVPFVCEEAWSKLGKKNFISVSRWPVADEGLISKEAESIEEMIKNTTEDIENILRVTKIRPSSIFLYSSPEWKWEVNEIIGASKNEKEAMKKAMEREELRNRAKEVSSYVKAIFKDITKLKIGKIDEFGALKDAKGFFEKEFGCKVEVFRAEQDVYDPMKKRSQAMPMKPAIYVE